MGQTSGQRDERFDKILNLLIEPLKNYVSNFKQKIIKKLDCEKEYDPDSVYSANVINGALNEIAAEFVNIRTEFTDGLSRVSELIGGAEE